MTTTPKVTNLYVPTSLGAAYIELERAHTHALYNCMVLRGKLADYRERAESAEKRAFWACFALGASLTVCATIAALEVLR